MCFALFQEGLCSTWFHSYQSIMPIVLKLRRGNYFDDSVSSCSSPYCPELMCSENVTMFWLCLVFVIQWTIRTRYQRSNATRLLWPVEERDWGEASCGDWKKNREWWNCSQHGTRRENLEIESIKLAVFWLQYSQTCQMHIQPEVRTLSLCISKNPDSWVRIVAVERLAWHGTYLFKFFLICWFHICGPL